MKPKLVASIISIGLISLIVVSGFGHATAVPMPINLKIGPYVDNAVYKVITNSDQRILALQADEVDLDASFFDPVHLEALDLDPDIDIFSALRNGYGYLTINCRDYPLNISGLRRAFAYAFDKTNVTADIMDGFSQEHDSVIPYVNSWCIEDEMPYHYYTAQIAIGNQILNDLGFAIDGGTGFRLAPNGAAFDIEVEYPSSSPEIGGGVAQIAVDALTALHIDASAVASDFNDYISRLDNHGAYDMVFLAKNFGSNDVDWLAYEYWSAFSDVVYQNPSNFENATYDSWRNQLLYGVTYEEVYEAASEMQSILQYNVPILVVYENVYFQAYRNDQFTGHVPDFAEYITGPWTMRKIHNIDGTTGGTVTIAISQEPDSFNFYVTNSFSSSAILKNLHASLFKYGPDLTPQMDLAQSMLVETHTDNPAVPTGHTRYTIDIIQNATWTDGMPLTAEDVAFTFVYQYESGTYGNPAAADLNDLVAAYAPNPYTVVIEFDSESYWQFGSFAFEYIIPQHIFNDVDGIGYAGWNTWNPVLNPAHPNVNCGPFIFTDYSAGNFYQISKNPFYHWRAPNPPPEVSSLGYIEYIEGTTGHEIVWQASDDNPLVYIVYKDSLPIISDVWDGTNIVVDIDGLTEGIYNYTIELYDYSLNIVSDTVIVNVTSAITTTSSTSPTTPTGPGGELPDIMVIAIAGGSIAVIIIVVVAIYKTKKT
ncbi:MAG: ABC transporter substrate-binding protein [Candidatus Thorarchaeota archaeon]